MSAEALDVLRSIDASLKELVRIARGRQPKAIATDRDIDGQYGDPAVKFMPRDWTGPSFKGRRFSECPAPLLDMLAETFDYFAQQAEQKDEKTTSGKAVAPYKRADAARARGWAKRIREGWNPTHAGNIGPMPATADEWPDQDGTEEPFGANDVNWG